MKQEEKELLLKDLCARLPYEVQCEIGGLRHGPYTFTYNDVEDLMAGRMFKPYLRPMSSMTDDEREEYRKLGGVMSYNPEHDTWAMCAFAPEAYDWLIKKQFDYRGLIPKGLAIEAPKDMYNN